MKLIKPLAYLSSASVGAAASILVVVTDKVGVVTPELGILSGLLIVTGLFTIGASWSRLKEDEPKV